MMFAINRMIETLNSKPCCVDPKLKDKVLNLLGNANNGSGTTFVYEPVDPGDNCASIGFGGPSTISAFLTKTVTISADGIGGINGCTCPLAGTIFHEMIHLTWNNLKNHTMKVKTKRMKRQPHVLVVAASDPCPSRK